MNRAKLAADIVEKRLKLVGVEMEEFRIDYIGYNSLYKSEISDQYAPDVFPEIDSVSAAEQKIKQMQH